MTDGALQVAAY
jgi:hypothetical protein